MRWFVLVAIVFGVGACGGGRGGGDDPDPNVVTRGKTAAPAYRHHHPRVVSHGAWYELTATVLAPDGMLTRTFKANTRTWTDWTAWGLPGGANTPPDPDEFGRHIPTTALDVRGSPAFGAIFQYVAGSARRQALPFVRNPSQPLGFSWHNEASPPAPGLGGSRRFRPVAIVGGTRSYAAYGTAVRTQNPSARTENPLIRANVSIATSGTVSATFTNLGEPTVTVEGEAQPARVAVGPSAAVEVPVTDGTTTTPTTFVVVKAVPSASEERVAVWTRPRNGAGKWTDLGLPDDTRGQLYGTPLALTRPHPVTRRAKIHVFITAYDDDGDRYTLYEREWDDTGGDVDAGWTGWVKRGHPPGLDKSTGFVLTTHAAWSTQGGPPRISVFGIADAGPHLIEYGMTGTAWSWGPAHPLPAEGMGVGTSSMAVLSFGAYRRVSVMCRALDGAVWEYAYQTGGAGTTTGWSWIELP